MKIANVLVMNMFRLEIRRNLALRDMELRHPDQTEGMVGLDDLNSCFQQFCDPKKNSELLACVLVGTILELETKACGMMRWVLDFPEFLRGVRRADAHVCRRAFTAH